MPRLQRPRQRPQRGAGLIALMVGMVISLLAVVAGLALYKSAVQQTSGPGGVVSASRQDGQLATGLLSAQIALQEAGFGIAKASAAEHLLLLRDARLDGGRLAGQPQVLGPASSAGNALLWTSNPELSADPARQVCQGLYADPVSRALLLLRVQGNCQPLAARWQQLDWQRRHLVAAELLAEPVALDARRNAGCWPYGALPEAMTGRPAPSAPVEVGLAYGSSVAGSHNRYTSCLSNLSE